MPKKITLKRTFLLFFLSKKYINLKIISNICARKKDYLEIIQME